MKNYIDNIEYISNKFYNQVNDIKVEYTWQNKTDKILNDLIGRVGIDMFKRRNEIYKL